MNIIGVIQALPAWYLVVNGMVLHIIAVHVHVHGIKLFLGIVIAGVVALMIGENKNTTI